MRVWFEQFWWVLGWSFAGGGRATGISVTRAHRQNEPAKIAISDCNNLTTH
jgi:hypothetical protein